MGSFICRHIPVLVKTEHHQSLYMKMRKRFYAHLRRNLPKADHYVQQMLQRQMKHTYYARYDFPYASLFSRSINKMDLMCSNYNVIRNSLKI
jgi:hypothetical protein